ncbi:MAG: bifunctional phosphoribosylaminoimidazolecarboxamide formyltransferase/IMP cyclohydrolase [Gammaproteobacteria bacterium]|nr:bifunctional phosphoribosylaminoimidazolecarboxamide formyltransferase/IMP cyclohydrolase [Gammaproteobacteria bacterium]
MHTQPITIRRALLSVSDKSHLVDFARGLNDLNIEMISTGGTAKLLRDESLPVTDVSAVTQFPEMMDGRVKTLHPKIHGGILGLRETHLEAAKTHDIHWIDLVIVNLYPFAKTIQDENVLLDDAIENIDIGGPAMIRSAAKNMGWVCVIVDPLDYAIVLSELQRDKTLSFATRAALAEKAFRHTADYDRQISDWFAQKNNAPVQYLQLSKKMDLRYGENPHQIASAWSFASNEQGILFAEQHQGKPLSYNNLVDADAAFQCVRTFTQLACTIVKHATPCGVATANDLFNAFQKAWDSDPLSAFGGIVALNHLCDAKLAEALTERFLEVVIASDYSAEALTILARKPNLRVLQMDFAKKHTTSELKFIQGGLLMQSSDDGVLPELQVVTEKHPDETVLADLHFAWQVVKHVKSNAIVMAKQNASIGIGGGQVSRIDAVEMALKKAGEKAVGSVLASDAFFPFRDSIDSLAGKGILAIIQPGGSQRDAEVIAACNEHGIAMVFTGKRCFKH